MVAVTTVALVAVSGVVGYLVIEDVSVANVGAPAYWEERGSAAGKNSGVDPLRSEALIRTMGSKGLSPQTPWARHAELVASVVAEDGAPVNNCRVMARAGNGQWKASLTDDDGVARIDVEPGRVEVLAFHARWGVATATCGISGHGQYACEVRFARARHVIAFVCNAGGEAIANAEVDLVLYSEHARSSDEITVVGPWGSTGAEGEASGYVDGNRFGLRVSAKGYLQVFESIGTADRVRIELALMRESVIRGRVIGRSVDVKVGAELINVMGDGWVFSRDLERLGNGDLVRDDGTFELFGVPSGTWRILAVSKMGGVGEAIVDVPLSQPVSLELSEPGGLDLRVTGRGAGVGSAEVGVDVVGGRERGSIWSVWSSVRVVHRRTGELGAVHIPIPTTADQGTSIGVRATGFEPLETVSVPAGGELDLALRPSARLGLRDRPSSWAFAKRVRLVGQDGQEEAVLQFIGDHGAWDVASGVYDAYVAVGGASGNAQGVWVEEGRIACASAGWRLVGKTVLSSGADEMLVSSGDSPFRYLVVGTVGAQEPVVEWMGGPRAGAEMSTSQGWVVCDRNGFARLVTLSEDAVRIRVKVAEGTWGSWIQVGPGDGASLELLFEAGIGWRRL